MYYISEIRFALDYGEVYDEPQEWLYMCAFEEGACPAFRLVVRNTDDYEDMADIFVSEDPSDMIGFNMLMSEYKPYGDVLCNRGRVFIAVSEKDIEFLDCVDSVMKVSLPETDERFIKYKNRHWYDGSFEYVLRTLDKLGTLFDGYEYWPCTLRGLFAESKNWGKDGVAEFLCGYGGVEQDGETKQCVAIWRIKFNDVERARRLVEG